MWRVHCVKNVALLFNNALYIYIFVHTRCINKMTQLLISVLLVTTALAVHKRL